MNTAELTIEEILAIYHRKRGLPKGTTESQWRRYHEDMLRHTAHYEAKRPKIEHFSNADDFRTAYSEWDINRSCFRPNEPGYYRANND